MRNWITNLPSPAKVSLVCGVLGFILSLSFSSSSTTNGAVTSCSYLDVGALGFGVVGVVTGGQAIAKAITGDLRPPDMRTSVLAVGAIGVLLGFLHVARGFGAVGGPC